MRACVRACVHGSACVRACLVTLAAHITVLKTGGARRSFEGMMMILLPCVECGRRVDDGQLIICSCMAEGGIRKPNFSQINKIKWSSEGR